MNYKEWLETTIGNMLVERNEKMKLKVYEQSNARYDGGQYDCTIVINGLGGTTDADVQVVPIQLMCLSGGQVEIDENGDTAYDIFYEVLKEFCSTYNYQSMVLDGFDYYRHNYVQPYPINPLEADNGTFRINFVISGSLTITKEVNDITKIYVNGTELPFITATLSYFTALSPTAKMNQSITRNVVQTAGYNLQIDLYNRPNTITNIAKAIRQEETMPNAPIEVTIQYSDSSIEELSNMIIDSFVVSSDRVNPSIAKVTLSKGHD